MPEAILTAARPLRIVMVAPGRGATGGQETQASTLEDRLRAEGHRVRRIPIDPAPPHALRWARDVRYARTILNEALYVRSLAALRRADVVHVFSASYWSFLLAPLPALLAGRLFGRRVILHYHSGEAEEHLGRWGMLVHPWLRLADAVVVPSLYLREVFAVHGYHTRHIPNIIETDRFRFRPRMPLQPRFVSTRNLEPGYRVDVTIRAFALLRERYPDATLLVAGRGSEEDRLRALASEVGPQGIRFLGALDRSHMPQLLERGDILLNASVIDNQPVSILEAFAAGLLVVTTVPGDLRHMVRDGETGRIVPPANPKAMAQAAAALLEDPERAARIAARARREAGRHSWGAVRDAWMKAYGCPVAAAGSAGMAGAAA
ncbi:MAG TPA: glycosyltransferase family 4 protein [Candidatus Polarisedimenticolia bacterium]|nr:glycosyltransferase family 4 protein [Candidatus Polarisedimenticolia bacterium]